MWCGGGGKTSQKRIFTKHRLHPSKEDTTYIRALTVHEMRVTVWVPCVAQSPGNARHGKFPRVSEPRMVLTHEVFFCLFLWLNAAFRGGIGNEALHLSVGKKKKK